MLSGARELLRPRQEAVGPQPEALLGGGKAFPPYAPFLPPKLGAAPWAPRDPARKRAAEAERVRQRRNDLKTSLSNTGQLALPH